MTLPSPLVPRHYGIRTERHKLMHFYEFDEWEYYDLENDPDELTNLYGSPEHAAGIEELKSDLYALRKHYHDTTDISEKPAEWQAKYR